MQKAFNTIEHCHMIKPGERVVVGVSGGADSVCLLLVLLEYRKKTEFDIKVVHVEHGIRGEDSLRDAAYVKELCEKQKVAYECVSVDIPAMAEAMKLSTEEAGRIARYRIFDQISKKWHADKIAVAHNQNDQAETILWNLVRGSGLDGAAGIRPVRGKIIRPLIECSRQEIEAYLAERKIRWCEDSTNKELNYTRNVIRNKILPEMRDLLNTKADIHLAAFGSEMRRTEEFLQKMTEEACRKMTDLAQNYVSIDLTLFEQEDAYLQDRILRTCLKEAGCGLKDIRREHVKSMKALTKAQSGKAVHLPGGWMAQRSFDRLMIKRTDQKNQGFLPEISLKIPGETQAGSGYFVTRIISNENQPIIQKKYTKWLNYDKISTGILLRGRKTGDYLVVNHQGGRKKLKAYLMEEKIPAELRDDIWLLTVGNEVIWVVGHRISEAYKVEESTKKILEITYKEAASWQRISEC